MEPWNRTTFDLSVDCFHKPEKRVNLGQDDRSPDMKCGRRINLTSSNQRWRTEEVADPNPAPRLGSTPYSWKPATVCLCEQYTPRGVLVRDQTAKREPQDLR